MAIDEEVLQASLHRLNRVSAAVIDIKHAMRRQCLSGPSDTPVTDEDLVEGQDIEVGDCDEFEQVSFDVCSSSRVMCTTSDDFGCQEDVNMEDDGSHGDAATRDFDMTVGVLQGALSPFDSFTRGQFVDPTPQIVPAYIQVVVDCRYTAGSCIC